MVTRGALGAFAVNLSGVGLAFGLHLLLSRNLGLENYGIYVFAFAGVSLLAMVAKLGQDAALVRFLPVLRAEENWPHLRGLLRLTTGVTLIAAVGAAAASGLLVWRFGAGLEPGLRAALWLGCLVMPLLALVQLRQAGLIGFQRAAYAESPDRILRPLMMIAAVLVLTAGLGRRLDAATAMAVHLAALAAAFVIAHAWLVRAVPQAARRAVPAYRTRHWLGASLPLLLVSTMHLILGQIDVLMVGSLIGAGDAGVYAAAARVAGFVLFGLIAINAIVAPLIAELHGAGRGAALQSMLRATAWVSAGFALAVGATVSFAGEWILSLFGADFTRGYAALVICVVGYLISALAGSVGFLMTMTGHERQAARIMGFAVAANIALNLVLIPLWGLVGAALATALTTAMWNLMMLAYTRRELDIDASAFSLRWRSAP